MSDRVFQTGAKRDSADGKGEPDKVEGNEEWRAVVGYEGLYEVSNKGRVRSLLKKRE